MNTNYVFVQKLDNGLNVWIAIDVVEGEDYVKIQFRNNNDEIVRKDDYPVALIKMLNRGIEKWTYNSRYPYVNLDNCSR